MMTDHELTDMVLAAMRQHLEEKDWPGASGFRDMANPAEHPADRPPAAPLKVK